MLTFLLPHQNHCSAQNKFVNTLQYIGVVFCSIMYQNFKVNSPDLEKSFQQDIYSFDTTLETPSSINRKLVFNAPNRSSVRMNHEILQ